jgi:SAM-dependent methyltransferase
MSLAPSQLPHGHDGLEPSLLEWFATPLGEYVLDCDQRFFDIAVSDVFGFHAVQIGLAPLPCLRESRIAYKHTLDWENKADLFADADALPFAADTLDLVVLPHTLEFVLQPHDVLREVQRVLRPEGQVVIAGFNPYSLFGAKRYFGRETLPPWNSAMISLYRIKDWLHLLGFDVIGGGLGAYAWPTQNPKWLQRVQWMDAAGDRWWPIAGGTYYLHAVKRVANVRLIRPEWREKTRRRRAAVAAHFTQNLQNHEHVHH